MCDWCADQHSPLSFLFNIYYLCFNFFWIDFPICSHPVFFLLDSVYHMMCWIIFLMHLLWVIHDYGWLTDTLIVSSFQHPSLWLVRAKLLLLYCPPMHPPLSGSQWWRAEHGSHAQRLPAETGGTIPSGCYRSAMGSSASLSYLEYLHKDHSRTSYQKFEPT